MKNPFRKTDPAAQAEAQIAKSETARAELEKKRGDVERRLDEAKSKLRTYVREHPAEDPPADLRHAVASTRDHLEAIVESIAGTDQQLVDLRATVIAERAQAERETAATALEVQAADIDQAAVELDRSMRAVGKAIVPLMKALPTRGSFELANGVMISHRPPDRDERGLVTARELLSMIIAEALYRERPDLFDEARVGGWGRQVVLHRFAGIDKAQPEFRHETGAVAPGGDAGYAVRALVTDRLRAKAAAIRLGDVPTATAPTAEPSPSSLPSDKPDIPDVQVFALQDFAYINDRRGGHALVGRRWVHDAPEPVADAAVAAGLALRTDTPEGAQAFQQEQTYRATSMSRPETRLALADCYDLGDVCGLTDADEDDLVAAE